VIFLISRMNRKETFRGLICNLFTMKRVFIFFIFISAGVLTFSQERILSYDIYCVIETDGTLLVREQIKVVAEGNEIKRGIYRSFPTKYTDRLGNRFRVGFEVTEVLKNGVPEPWFTENRSNGIVVYIGDRDVELTPGVYEYSLSFRTTRQIGFFRNYDELYYNAIGGDWVFPIEAATVTVQLPAGADVVQKAAYSGFAGSTGCDCEMTVDGNVVTLTTTRPLQPREQLTFAVAWPKGFVTPPSVMQKMTFFLKDNRHVVFALAGLVITILLYYWKWRIAGKDPAKGTIIPLYDPPEGFSPAATGYLAGMGMKERVITSALVNMAVNGYITIYHTKKKYSISLVPEAATKLNPEEKALADVLFSREPEIELDNKNHELFEEARNKVNDVLKGKLTPEYFKFNTRLLLSGFIFSVIWTILAFIISPSPLVPIILIVLFLALLLLFFWLIKAPTVRGRALMDEAEGFRMYLSVAEKDRLNLADEPELTPGRFEKYLPFAIALGVENAWGKRFENALKRSLKDATDYSPSWYVGPASAAKFSPLGFTSSVGHSFSSAISSASMAPGSSSGSGGGGSSGGGGGGGGGGGW